MLKVDVISTMLKAVESLQDNPLAMVALISMISLGVVGLALYVVLAALKQRGT